MSSSSQVPESWIAAFCSLVGHEYFAEVSEDFIEDDFNLTGLQSQVQMYKEALEMILDVEPEDASDEDEEEDDDDDEDEDEMHNGQSRSYKRQDAAERRHLRMASDLSVIETNAELLYGLIHQRYITSRQGIQQMAEKYEFGHFGNCPRVHCHGAKVLPVGCSDIPGQETVKLFCPSCLDVYNPPNSRFQTVDGAFFGTTFGCLFFMTFPELDVAGKFPGTAVAGQPDGNASASSPAYTQGRSSLASSLTSNPMAATNPSQIPAPVPQQPASINGVSSKNLAPGLGPSNIYEPRIYGFRVSEVAKTGPRMKWLRSKPADINELDECALWLRSQEGQSAPVEEPADLGDSEMAEANEEIDDGEVEDQDMDIPNVDGPADIEGSVDARELAVERKKNVKRREHDSLTNGDVGGAAVRVSGRNQEDGSVPDL